MGETFSREFSLSGVPIAGTGEPATQDPTTVDPFTGEIQFGKGSLAGPPETRPSFLQAFLANLPTALASAAPESGFGKAVKGIQERSQQQQKQAVAKARAARETELFPLQKQALEAQPDLVKAQTQKIRSDLKTSRERIDILSRQVSLGERRLENQEKIQQAELDLARARTANDTARTKIARERLALEKQKQVELRKEARGFTTASRTVREPVIDPETGEQARSPVTGQLLFTGVSTTTQERIPKPDSFTVISRGNESINQQIAQGVSLKQIKADIRNSTKLNPFEKRALTESAESHFGLR